MLINGRTPCSAFSYFFFFVKQLTIFSCVLQAFLHHLFFSAYDLAFHVSLAVAEIFFLFFLLPQRVSGGQPTELSSSFQRLLELQQQRLQHQQERHFLFLDCFLLFPSVLSFAATLSYSTILCVCCCYICKKSLRRGKNNQLDMVVVHGFAI